LKAVTYTPDFLFLPAQTATKPAKIIPTKKPNAMRSRGFTVSTFWQALHTRGTPLGFLNCDAEKSALGTSALQEVHIFERTAVAGTRA